jgi:hypothetical protein
MQNHVATELGMAGLGALRVQGLRSYGSDVGCDPTKAEANG